MGQPDGVNFPAPPLFALGSITPMASLNLVATGTVNPTGSGWVSDGWGWGPMHIQLPAGQYPSSVSDGVHRKVLTASLAGSTATITMAPSGHVELSVQSPTTYGATMGTADGFLGVPEYAYPITLSAPNPLTNPLLGDGTNQYVYDTRQPDGYLTVPASVNVAGASTDDTTFLLPHVGLFVSPAMQTGAQPFQWENFGQQMYVYTDGAYPDQTSFPSAAFIYKGLPPNNSYFGNHVMTMKVDGNVSEIANYQLFFNATANNYPGAYYGSDGPGPMYSGIPNWYFYYSQLYTTYGNYYNTSSSYWDYWGGIHIGNDAHGSYGGLRVFDLQADATGKKWVHLAGSLSIKGIHTFIYTCEHEQGHANDAQNGIQTLSGSGTADGDGVDDAWEARNNFKNYDYDTARAYLDQDPNSSDYQKGDKECLCDIQALGKLLPKKGVWQQDWANDGIQWGKWAPYGEVDTPNGPMSLLYFPWNYVPSDGGNHPDPPGSVLVSLSQLDGGGK